MVIGNEAKWASSSRTTGRGSSSSPRQPVSEETNRSSFEGEYQKLISPTRSNCRSFGGLLLAEDLLRLPHKDAGPGRQAIPDTADCQSGVGHTAVCLGVAAGIHRWVVDPPEPRGSSGGAAVGGSRLHPHLPGNQRGTVLRGCHGCVFLGIQRGRGMLLHAPPLHNLQYPDIPHRLSAPSPGHYLNEAAVVAESKLKAIHATETATIYISSLLSIALEHGCKQGERGGTTPLHPGIHHLQALESPYISTNPRRTLFLLLDGISFCCFYQLSFFLSIRGGSHVSLSLS